ncbi:uncharacterized protein LOC100272377 [Zea mays]|jgi:hypothetical protein|uniref:DUF1279 domain-containing protein n=1 Tax=Zea mays TaxID=4577 RepID=B4FNA3_MAIZE|nr:uncharacterized protein LOC100272377 [Zea mays]NP_001356249.1 uncharacterized protein LOC100272377 [Zea mays]ACF83596.1 unknown [Zea mays]ACG48458.1 hypothetical protein [Zea mays]ACN31263.1 unknown [Zea mays]|eukprot:NP_001140330.1 uncharacterized protein LOC100272377 [Zea mays]
MAFSGRIKQLVKKYGKVAAGVHLSVSFASIFGLYAAINNNVDVEAVFRRFGISPGVAVDGEASPSPAPVSRDEHLQHASLPPCPSEVLQEESEQRQPRNRTMELVALSGGPLGLALLCNKALLPVRIPITIALTPPVARALSRWKLG